jgi:hypothetical protein
MLDNIFGSLFQLQLDAIPISVAGWLGICLLVWSVERGESSRVFGGPFTFMIIWGVTVFANYETQGRASPILETLYFSLLALGMLVTLVCAAIRILKRPHYH